MLKRFVLSLCLLFPALAHAQFLAGVPPITGTINSSGSACASLSMDSTNAGPSNCVSRQLPSQASAASIVLSGTFSATVQFELSADSGRTWIAAPTASSSAAGTTNFSVGGYSGVRARASAYTSGTIAVTITIGVGATGGGGTITQVSAGTGLSGGGSGGPVTLNITTPASPGVLCLPAIYGGVNTLGAVGSQCDVTQFAGATLDVKGNLANTYLLETNGGILDARAASGAQTIASEWEIGELKFPTLTAISSGTPLAAGTYRVTYHVTTPTLPGGSTESMEGIITLGDSAHSIQVAVPFAVTATTYSVSMTNSTAWTELACTGLSAVAIASSAVIDSTNTTANDCTGAAISLQNTQTVEFVPPKAGIATVTIVDSVANTSCGLKFFNGSSATGGSGGEGRAWKLSSQGGGTPTNVEALICTDNNPRGGNGYYKIVGMSARGVAGDAVQTAEIIWRNFTDVSVFDDTQATCATAIPCLWAYGNTVGSGAGTRISGNFEGSNTGKTLVVGRSGFTTSSVTFHDISAVHPGTGLANIELQGSLSDIHFAGTTYTEGNATPANCSDVMQIATLNNVNGPITVDDLRAGAGCAATSAFLFNVPSSFTVGALRVNGYANGQYANIFNYNPDTTKNIVASGTGIFSTGFTYDKTDPYVFDSPIAVKFVTPPTVLAAPVDRTICVNVTPVTVNANVATDQSLQACTVPIGLLNSIVNGGRTLQIWTAGVYSTAASSTAQMTLKAKLCTVSGCGSGTVVPLVAVQSAALGTITVANDPWNLTGYATTQTGGTSAVFEAHGALSIDLAATTTAAASVFPDTSTAVSGAINSTLQLFLQITGTFSAASASNSMTGRQLIVGLAN